MCHPLAPRAVVRGEGQGLGGTLRGADHAGRDLWYLLIQGACSWPMLRPRCGRVLMSSGKAGSNPNIRRNRGARPLADLVAPGLADVCGRVGFSVVEVVTHWDEIVGPDLAPHCVPLKLQWPRQEEGGAATLVVRVSGAYAIEMQYAAPVVMERINTYFGWRCVGRLALRQGPVPPRYVRPPAPVEPEPQEVEEISREIGTFGDEALNASLARLGALVRRERRGRK